MVRKLNHSNKTNYRTVSILPLVSTEFEKIMYDALYEYIQYPLFRLLQKRQKSLTQRGFIGTILIDFSKGYDCLPRDIYNTQKKHL